MSNPYSDKQLRAFAEWMNQPLTAGTERALNRWLSENPSNQETWDRWQRVNARAKQFQVLPSDVNHDWAHLRDELGFVHTGKQKKRSRSSSRSREFHKQPAVVAIMSMIVYSLFLYLLHMLRVKVGF